MESTEPGQEAVSPQPPPAPSPRAFDVFISYSHKDKDFAVILEKALERYRLASGIRDGRPNLNVFRDESDIEASEDYGRTIEEHLRNSKKLLVICSPDARQSLHVEDEIKRFIQIHGGRGIIPVLLRGKPNNETEIESEKAFPNALSSNRMPLAANFIGYDKDRDKPDKGGFYDNFYKILSNIYGIDRRTLEQIDERRRTRNRARIIGITAAVIVTLLVLLFYAVSASRHAREEAETSRRLRYASDINVAQRAYEGQGNNIALGLELLESHLPGPDQDDLRGFEWYYLWQLYHQDSATLNGPLGSARSVAYSPKGGTLATGGLDNTVRLWDAASHQLRAILQPEMSTSSGDTAVTSVAFSSDDKTLAAGSEDDTARIWDTKSGQLLATLKGHTGNVNAVAFSPDGATLATASEDKTVKLWDTASKQLIATLEGHTDSVQYVTFFSDGKTIASSSVGDNTTRLWDMASHKMLASINAVGIAIAFTSDGKMLATGSTDNTVKLWDTASKQLIATLEGHPYDLWAIAFSPDCKLIASADWAGIVKVWDIAAKRELATFKGHKSNIWGAAFSPDSKTLATASNDDTVKLWDISSFHEPTIITDPADKDDFSAFDHPIAFSPDGATLAAGGRDGTVKLWNAASHQLIATLEGHKGMITAVAFSPDGKSLVVAAGDDKTVRLWDVASHQLTATLDGHSKAVTSVAFSHDGRILATGSDDTTVKLWNAASHQLLATLEGHAESVHSIAFAPDDRTLATGDKEATARLWDTTSYREVAKLKAKITYGVTTVAFSTDGKILVLANDYDSDKTVTMWDAASHQLLTTLRGHIEGITAIALSHDGRTLATGDKEGAVKLWQLASRRELFTLRAHNSRVGFIAFSPDDRMLATSSTDNTLKLWRGATDTEVTARRSQKQP